jgi:hypothetical protein
MRKTRKTKSPERRTSRPAAEPACAQAIGAFEAAALMGTHFTIPYRLAERGKLTVQYHEGPAGRKITFFDGRECEENWLDYCEAIAGEGTGKRPRSHTDDRPAVIKHLAAVATRIVLSDAISTPEAVEILGMMPSYVIILAQKGKIVGRQLWSGRSHKGPKQWMFSRKSCLANVAQVKAAFAAGPTVGRIRDSIKFAGKKSL